MCVGGGGALRCFVVYMKKMSCLPNVCHLVLCTVYGVSIAQYVNFPRKCSLVGVLENFIFIMFVLLTCILG